MKPGSDQAIINAGVSHLAELYGTRATTPNRVLELYLDRISAFDGRLGAFLTVRNAEARQEAAESAARWASQMPLSHVDGVPIAVKANIAVAGAAWHAGIRAYADRIAQQDATCVAALRAKGAVIIGHLNMDEGGLGARGDNPVFGRTENPHRSGFTAGGSSSGAGAAVAAGLCAAALGTDTMGSVRIPAAFCGCFGYKPSRGAISLDGVVPLSPTLDHVGCLGRSVEDCAVVAAAAAAHPQALRRLPQERLRLGIPLDLAGASFNVETETALHAVVRRAQLKGAEIVPIDLRQFDFGRLRRACLLAVEVEAMTVHSPLAVDAAGYSAEFIAMVRWGISQPPHKRAAAYGEIAGASKFAGELLSGITALILPAVPEPAFHFKTPTPANLADFTVLANVSGLAAITVPIGRSAEGLPLALQCLGVQDGGVLAAGELLADCADPVGNPPGWGLA